MISGAPGKPSLGLFPGGSLISGGYQYSWCHLERFLQVAARERNNLGITYAGITQQKSRLLADRTKYLF